jgi:hypothetical protein
MQRETQFPSTTDEPKEQPNEIHPATVMTISIAVALFALRSEYLVVLLSR